MRKFLLLLILFWCSLFIASHYAKAVDTKISALPAASAITGVEAFPCVQGGVTDKCTVTQAQTFLNSQFSGDCTVSAGGAITCTKTGGVAFTVLATAATPLSIANGGNGTASPGLTAGTGITLGSTWPTQSVAITSPVTIANGGTGQTAAGAAFNALSPMTTVGDIIYGGASGVGTRLANGTTGQYLGANTGAAPSWSTPAGGSAQLQTYNTGRFYSLGGTATVGGTASTANVITCMRGHVYQKLTFSVLNVNITTGGSSNLQMALYNDTNGLPGTLLSSTPNVADTGTLATPGTLASSVQTGPGAVWFCTNQNDSTVVMTSVIKTTGPMGPIMGGTVAQLVSTAAGPNGIQCTGANCNGGSSTFGTWPDLTGSTWTNISNTVVPQLFFQPLSVP